MRILGIHHITLAVRDVDEACDTFESLFGVSGGERRAVPAFGVRAVDVRLGGDAIEFAAPMYPDNPVRRFLERKGEGFYALALQVDDIQAAVRELAAKGVRVSAPVESEPGIYSAFVTMSATHGLSIQLVEVAGDGDAAAPSFAPPPSAPDAIDPGEAGDLPDAPAQPGTPAPLDLTPDEWSDVD
jgi:methylmalonyl-CoA/ethylmalonyl-CoA epimerase